MFRLILISALLSSSLLAKPSLAAGDSALENVLKVGDRVALEKSPGGGWNLTIVPANGKFPTAYSVRHVKADFVVLRTADRQETAFGKLFIEKTIPWSAISEVSRFFDQADD